MRVSTLTAQEPSAIHDALVRRGLDPGRADAVTRGLASLALLFEPVEQADWDTLAAVARAQGLECVTGEGWVIIAGSAATLAGLVGPGKSILPADIEERVGQLLQAVVQPRHEWEMERGTVPLERPVVVGVLNVSPH